MKVCWDNLNVLRYNNRTEKWYKDRYNKNGRIVGMTPYLLNEDGCCMCGESFFYGIANKGICCSLNCNTKLKNSIYGISEETAKRIGNGNRGKKRSEEVKKKMSKRMKKMIGPLNYNWKGGITSENGKIYNSKEYNNWRKSVFERDDYTCQFYKCKKKGGKIEAHHIKKFSDYKHLRFDINNGITLCVECHRKIKGQEDFYEDMFHQNLSDRYVSKNSIK